MRHGAFASVSNNTQLCGSALLYAGSGSQDPSAREKMTAIELAVINPVTIRVGRRSSVSALRSGPAALREEVVTLE
ncbi:hypothetical protein KC359_g90 [Hortaea werneckii]|nr:hypothetical protein KC359_g90 [Hortaea werneckii]